VARLRTADDPVGWSAGTSEWLRGEELGTALARADTLLYEEKRSKRRPPLERSHRTLNKLAPAGATGVPRS